MECDASGRNTLYVGLALMLCLSTAGCGPWHWPRLGKAKAASGLQIAPRNNRYALTRPLTADDIVTMMLNVGFSEKQTVELGESLRNALMFSGAAEVRRGKDRRGDLRGVRKRLHLHHHPQGRYLHLRRQARSVRTGTRCGALSGTLEAASALP